MNHMILSFKMKGDIISDHFFMLWFQKDSQDTVGFRIFRTFFRGRRVGVRESKLNREFWWTNVTFGVLNVLRGGGVVT